MSVIEKIDEIYNRGVDLKQFIKLYQDFLVDILVYGNTKTYKQINIPSTYEIDYNVEEIEAVEMLLHAIIELNSDVKRQQNPRYFVRAKFLTLGV
jgi:DNA polymerase III gamma/tau subunit